MLQSKIHTPSIYSNLLITHLINSQILINETLIINQITKKYHVINNSKLVKTELHGSNNSRFLSFS